ncbi:hypothetical protein [Paenibacillus sp. RUD330]|uniref:hypothetical protein n=1 Tax=Paenibacillus sp. RUD330 TaxID=2023772 RepID=UPI000B929097|nr:hypothetical protein [Paenibacillus sp. RUD330]ASS64718.1 hypothetical protein CIC07_00285 [Paenibacillus sp. RUD330]
MQDERYYSELHARIVTGAEFIESLAPGDPKLPAAHSKYDKLVEEYRHYIRLSFWGKEELEREETQRQRLERESRPQQTTMKFY